MTWFKVDDGWARHPKTRKAGRDARSLWVTSGTECAAASTSGVVASHLLRDYAYLADVKQPTRAATALVDAGLWHDHATLVSCAKCVDALAGVELEPGAFYFHDWTDHQPTKADTEDPVKHDRWKRRKALSRDPDLCRAIRHRDRDHCRYCDQHVEFRSRRGPLGGTYDHVDPAGENTFENVVVACRRCNGRKRDRTPEDAGMPLLPVPGPYLAASSPGPETGQIETWPVSSPDLASRGRGAQDGTGQERAGPDLAAGQVGPGRARTGGRGPGVDLAGSGAEP